MATLISSKLVNLICFTKVYYSINITKKKLDLLLDCLLVKQILQSRTTFIKYETLFVVRNNAMLNLYICILYETFKFK